MNDLPHPQPAPAIPANQLIGQSRSLCEHSHTRREASRRLRAHFREVCAQAGLLVTDPCPAGRRATAWQAAFPPCGVGGKTARRNLDQGQVRSLLLRRPGGGAPGPGAGAAAPLPSRPPKHRQEPLGPAAGPSPGQAAHCEAR